MIEVHRVITEIDPARLAELVDRSGRTQTDIATRIGMSKSAFGKLLKGERATMPEERFDALVTVLREAHRDLTDEELREILAGRRRFAAMGVPIEAPREAGAIANSSYLFTTGITTVSAKGLPRMCRYVRCEATVSVGTQTGGWRRHGRPQGTLGIGTSHAGSGFKTRHHPHLPVGRSALRGMGGCPDLGRRDAALHRIPRRV